MARRAEPAERRWRTSGEALGIVVSDPFLRRTLITAVVVGTILSLINQGHIIIGGTPTIGTWLRVFANYLMPFLVSNIGVLVATRREPDERGGRSLSRRRGRTR